MEAICEQIIPFHLAVAWLDDVHHLAAVGFHECSVDIVRCDCLHGTLPDFRVKTSGVACDPIVNVTMQVQFQ